MQQMLRFCNKTVIFIYIKIQRDARGIQMYTTTDDGILNNYAIEPAMSYAEYPSEPQQRRYALQAAAASLLISFLVLTALTVS
jgi:hypothetical protein